MRLFKGAEPRGGIAKRGGVGKFLSLGDETRLQPFLPGCGGSLVDVASAATMALRSCEGFGFGF